MSEFRLDFDEDASIAGQCSQSTPDELRDRIMFV